ncbi:MAG: TolC family protein [Alphaproteobacteria bacterium]|nr:TolC family protein [Alphaproteobacteria bacterium]
MISDRFSYWLLAGSCLLFLSSPARAESLKDAIQSALATHPSAESAKAAIEIARETLTENRSDYFPEFNVNLGGGRLYGENSTSRGLVTSRGAAYSWLWEGSTSLTQNIFNGMETKNRVAAASARETAAVLNVADTMETLALRTTQAYLSVARAQDNLKSLRSYQDKIADFEKRVQEMVTQGAADESESAQARNISLMLKDSEAELEGQLNSALASYQEMTGSVPAQALEKPKAPGELIASGAESVLAAAREHHPSLKSIAREIEAAQFDAKAEEGTLLPDLDGELSYLKRDQKEEIGGESEDRRAMLRANWDFSLGGGDMARVRKARATSVQNAALLLEKQREIERDIRLAYAELGTARKQYEVATEREQVTTQLRDAYLTQFEGARVRLLQVMQAENQVFSTQLDKINADYRVAAAEFAVLASAGKLQDSVINMPDRPAQPSAAPVQKQDTLRDQPTPEISAEEPPTSSAQMLEHQITHSQKDQSIPKATSDMPAAASVQTPEQPETASPAMISRQRQEYKATEADRALPRFDRQK